MIMTPDRDAAVHYASIDQLILFCIVIIKWVPEREWSGNGKPGAQVTTYAQPLCQPQNYSPDSDRAAEQPPIDGWV